MSKTDLYLLTGFLGAGKTTLLTNILKDLESDNVGVIMNEFGKVGIDGTIIEKDGMVVTELNRGSIFCSCLQLKFVDAMAEMADRSLKYLFVESSGLADPSNIGNILGGVESIKGDAYSYKGAICLIDGVNFLEQLKDIETVERQLKHCHLAVINKVDLIDESEISQIKEKIAEINNKVDVVETTFGQMPYSFLGKDLIENRVLEIEDTTNTPDSKPKTLNLTFDGQINKALLTEFIDRIKGDCFRIKGYFNLEDGLNQVDVVNKKIDFKIKENKEAPSQLVFISKIGPQIIRPIVNAWDEVVGEKMKLR